MKLRDYWPWCLGLEPIRPGLMPYQCTRGLWHVGAHRAQLDGRAVAAWPRSHRRRVR